MLKGILYSLLFSFEFCLNASGQNMYSLKLALKNAKHDTTRCNILSAMVEVESDDAVWPQYNEQLLKLWKVSYIQLQEQAQNSEFIKNITLKLCMMPDTLSMFRAISQKRSNTLLKV